MYLLETMNNPTRVGPTSLGCTGIILFFSSQAAVHDGTPNSQSSMKKKKVSGSSNLEHYFIDGVKLYSGSIYEEILTTQN